MKFCVVNSAIIIDIGLCNHFFNFVIGKFFAKMHHTTFEFVFADESIAIAIENVWAFAEATGAGGYAVWLRLWAAAGYIVTTTFVASEDAVPMVRNRAIVCGWNLTNVQ